MNPFNNKEYVLKTVKEIFNFALGVIMFFCCLAIITYGSAKLHIGYLGFIPFLYFAIIFFNRVSKIVEEKENLENNLQYCKHRLEKYETICKENK